MLDIDCFSSGYHGEDALTPALEALPPLNRLKSIRIEIHSNGFPHSTFYHRCRSSHISQAAIHLQEFVVTFTGSRTSGITSYHRIDSFLSGHAPALRHLKILPFFIDWDSPILRNLTKLHITAWDGRNSPTAEQFQRVLESCPLLEELQVRGEDGDRQSDGCSFLSVIHLSSLRSLELCRLPWETAHSLLKTIRGSDTIRVSVDDVRSLECNSLLGDLATDSVISHILESPFGASLEEAVNDFTLSLFSKNEVSSFIFKCNGGAVAAYTAYNSVFSASARSQLKFLRLRNFAYLLRVLRPTFTELFQGFHSLRDLEIVEKENPMEHETFQIMLLPLTIGSTGNRAPFENLQNMDLEYHGNSRSLLRLLRLLRERYDEQRAGSGGQTTSLEELKMTWLQPLKSLVIVVRKLSKTSMVDYQATYDEIISILGKERYRANFI
ncbi:hypothetical protein FRC03_006564 [Tulasnella sp. 419]|nr:hypothetical protein FRC03_006564 [Tulasnella sp. 419]